MNLKELRKQNKKTQLEIATKINIPLMTYNNYENEKTEPNIKTLCKLADLYNVTLDYLVGRNFGNDLGFLTQQQFNYIKLFLKLNETKQAKATGFVISLLENQN